MHTGLIWGHIFILLQTSSSYLHRAISRIVSSIEDASEFLTCFTDGASCLCFLNRQVLRGSRLAWGRSMFPKNKKHLLDRLWCFSTTKNMVAKNNSWILWASFVKVFFLAVGRRERKEQMSSSGDNMQETYSLTCSSTKKNNTRKMPSQCWKCLFFPALYVHRWVCFCAVYSTWKSLPLP